MSTTKQNKKHYQTLVTDRTKSLSKTLESARAKRALTHVTDISECRNKNTARDISQCQNETTANANCEVRRPKQVNDGSCQTAQLILPTAVTQHTLYEAPSTSCTTGLPCLFRQLLSVFRVHRTSLVGFATRPLPQGPKQTIKLRW